MPVSDLRRTGHKKKLTERMKEFLEKENRREINYVAIIPTVISHKQYDSEQRSYIRTSKVGGGVLMWLLQQGVPADGMEVGRTANDPPHTCCNRKLRRGCRKS